MAEVLVISKKQYEPIRYVDDAPVVFNNQKIDGRTLGRKTVGDDKVTSITDIPNNAISTAMIQALAVTSAKLAAAAVTQSKLSYEVVDITVAIGNPSNTGTCTSGSIVIGVFAIGNQDQLIDSVGVSGTTVTVTLAGNAVAANNIRVILLKA